MRVPVELLSPDEFEKFSNKIIEIKFNTRIISFGEGPDGGIDGLDNSVNPSIIVQSKRYHPSVRPREFINTVKKEIEKLEKTISKYKFRNDIDYIVVTSNALNPAARYEIRNLKPEWIKSDEHILDSIALDDLSYESKYKEIYKRYNLIDKELVDVIRNFELLNIKIESETFFDDFNIEFVIETDAVQKAYNYLLNNHVVFLAGQPGVGKTTCSQYLGVFFANHKNKEVEVVKRSINDIDKVIEKYSESYHRTDKTLLVVFDDFLGRNKFDKDDESLSNVTKFVSILSKVENLYAIFNSRKQILQEASGKNIEFNMFYEDIEEKVTVDISEVSELDKAKILRKNFEKMYYLERTPVKQSIEYNYNQLLENKMYLQIVRHNNYIPRSIEFLVRESRNEHQNFPEIAIKILDNPKLVYQEIFTKLCVDAKMLLYCIAAFNSFPIPIKEINLAFRVLQQELASLDELLAMLEGAWLNKYYVKEDKEVVGYIDFINPSIFDYVSELLYRNDYVKNLLKNKIPLLSPIQNLDNEFFLEQISNFDTFMKYEDKERFIGNRIVALASKKELSEKESHWFSEAIEKFEGQFYKYSVFLDMLVTCWWYDILWEIYNSENDEIKSLFATKLLHEKDNFKFFQEIEDYADIESVNEIIKMVEEILFYEELEQNEIIDLADEETSVNIVEEFTHIIEKCIIDDLTTLDTNDLLRQYFKGDIRGGLMNLVSKFGNNEDDENGDEFDVEISGLVVGIFKYYLEKNVVPNISDSFYEGLNFDEIYLKVEGHLSEAILQMVYEYHFSLLEHDEERSIAFMGYIENELDLDLEIDKILNRKLE